MHQYERGLEQNPLTAENLEKIKTDMDFCNNVLFKLCEDLRTTGCFKYLVEAVSEENHRMSMLKDLIHQ